MAFGLKRKKAPAALSYEESKALAEGGSDKDRADLASREDLRPELLYYLSQDPSSEVRRRIAANDKTPRQADLRPQPLCWMQPMRWWEALRPLMRFRRPPSAPRKAALTSLPAPAARRAREQAVLSARMRRARGLALSVSRPANSSA